MDRHEVAGTKIQANRRIIVVPNAQKALKFWQTSRFFIFYRFDGRKDYFFSILLKMKVWIKEGTLFARMAARKLKCDTVAAVLGNTIHLWNISREEFLKRTPWVAHEIEHVRQFQRYGFFRFCALYLWESVRRGYHNNRFEVEARVVEAGTADLSGIEFL